MNHKVIIKYLLICLFSTSALNGFGQKTIQSNNSNQDSIVTFYTWGMPTKLWNGDNCDSIIERRMGFKKVTKGGCITPPNHKELERHNKKSENAMRRKFGKKWRELFEEEVRKCQGK